MIRNYLLSDCDWTQMPDADIDTDTKAMWTKYRAKLRSLPQDNDGKDADEVQFPINPIAYKVWESKVDLNNQKLNEGKVYLETDGQFGTFDSTTYSEYARRIVLTIASNYKVKNPDVIFTPANYKDYEKPSEEIKTKEDLDKLLAQIQANNV